MLTRVDFGDFFAAVRLGQRPFAWQERLLDDLIAAGSWPDRVVAPTGAGKTAVIDVHVFANALAAHGAAARLPRRLVLAVDRRAVVDSHDEHARHLAALLTGVTEGVLAQVAAALRSLRVPVVAATGAELDVEDDPLVTARLRGGAPAPRGWRYAPEVCAVLTGTPDMLGSRLLLQGYGSSPRAWPQEAGLLAFDTALVVDEAHLSQQFLLTARRLAGLAVPAGAVTGGVPVLQVVETTATPGAGSGRELGVEEPDLEDQVLRRRMCTPKPVELLALPAWPLMATARGVASFAGEVERARRDFGPTVGAVLNRVAPAVELAKTLRQKDLNVVLLVGRMRPADVAGLRRRYPGLLDSRGNAEVDVLVATQTVEVGLDLDLSALVTELAPAPALAQRSGRVNRKGDRASTRVVVAVPEAEIIPDKGAAPYTGEDLTVGQRWLQGVAASAAGLAPWAVRQDAPPPQESRRTVLRHLELTDSWAWGRTGDDAFALPDLALWLSDDLDADRDLGLVVRSDLPEDPGAALALMRLLPPRAYESFAVGRSVMTELVEGWLSSADGGAATVLRWRGGDLETLSSPPDLRVGDVVVVDSRTPVQQEGVVSREGDLEAAQDVFEQAPRQPDGNVRVGDVALRWGTLTLDELAEPVFAVLPPAAREVLGQGPAGSAGDWSREQRAALGIALAQVQPRRGHDSAAVQALLAVRDAAVDLLTTGRVKDLALHVLDDAEGEPALLVLLDLRRAAADEDARQTWTPGDHAVPLDEHASAVAQTASALARAVGLGDAPVEVLRLAGLHHDDGKADPRFQTLLGRVPGGPLLAKSARRPASGDRSARSAAGLPSGWRHEQLSALHAGRAVTSVDRELVIRLVGTTHGRGRLSFPHGAATLLGTVGEPLPDDARELFDEGGWEEIVQDSDERYGVWGLAYLEALLRAADGRVSGAGS